MTSALFANAGRLGAAYEAVDWATTSLGPPEQWSPTLCSTLDLALHSKFPMTLFWGPDRLMLYNEAYVDLIGAKHPVALGRSAEEVFPEAWDIVGPLLASVRAEDRPVWVEDALVPLDRAGFMEECYFTFSYSPVHGPDGEIEGLIDIATETTTQVVAARRLRLLSRLKEALADVETLDDVPKRAAAVFESGQADLPEVEIRLPSRADRREPAAAQAGTDEGAEDGRVVTIPVPTTEPDTDGTTLVVRLSPYLPSDADYVDFLTLVATSLAQALDRTSALEAERGFSAALQRSLLTEPPASRRFEVAVRYQPAAEVAQIGGDWYDAFLTPDGGMTVIVGDVAGHDRDAAAGMAQVRNLARGIAWTLGASPAEVLTGLDEAMQGLDVSSVATGVVARVDRLEGGRLLVRWANAGHPFPAVLAPDGSAKLLETKPDLLLGLEPSTVRHEHRVVLDPGSSLVLYTDGLVERRGVPLDVSLGWLQDAVRDRQGLSAEQLCDHLLGLLHGRAEDDVALLVMRVPPR